MLPKATHKIIAAISVAVLLAALGMAASFWLFSQLEESAAARQHTYGVLEQASKLLSGLRDAETGQRGYLITGQEKYLEPYLAARDDIAGDLAKLIRITAIEEARERLAKLAPVVDAKLAEMAQTIELRRSDRAADALEIVKQDHDRLTMDLIRAELSHFRTIEESALSQYHENAASDRNILLAVVGPASLGTLLAALWFAFLVYTETLRLLAIEKLATQRQEQANAILQVSEEKLAVTLNSIGDAVIATDTEGRVTLLNPFAERLTGWTRTQATGRPVGEIFRVINAETRQPAPVPVMDTLASGTTRNLNKHTVLIARDGGEHAIADSCAPIRDRGGLVVGAVLVFRDVTEVKRFERALQEKNIELEHAGRMKSEFLATMSHELRTPLNAIIGFSEAIKDGLVGQTSEAQHEYINDIFNAGQHLLSLINDVLDLSKVEAGMMTLELEPVDLNALLADSLTMVREKAAARRIGLELDAGEDLGVPQLDLRKTKQIVYNLISNAVKFSSEGGRVTLRARRVPRSAVGTLTGAWPVHAFPLAEAQYDEFLEISVKDNGIGLSEESMARLFQPFVQIDSSLARKFEGTGLGLAMVRQLAELHGGTVAVSSAEGEGACFAAWLPLRTQVQVAAATEPPGIGVATTGATEPALRTALVVEDDDQTAGLIRMLLEAEGFSVLRAASAEAALVLAPQQTLSLITLDIRLPGIDGWEFLARIRESPTLADVPVVVIAGDVDNNMTLAGGATAVMQKPISRAQLKSTLDRLRLHPSREETRTILVVDDDPKAVEVIAAYLRAPAYAVVRAYGGAEAINLAQRVRPDLILLDLMMPDVSGFDVVEALRRNTDTAHTPILVVTAKQISTQERDALNRDSGKVIRTVEKSGFNSVRFMAEVRRALSPTGRPKNREAGQCPES